MKSTFSQSYRILEVIWITMDKQTRQGQIFVILCGRIKAEILYMCCTFPQSSSLNDPSVTLLENVMEAGEISEMIFRQNVNSDFQVMVLIYSLN